jgi:hypothetical protein
MSRLPSAKLLPRERAHRSSTGFWAWDGHSAPSPPSTSESARGWCAPATEIPRTQEIQLASSSRRNRSRCAIADTGCATAPGDGPWWRSKESEANGACEHDKHRRHDSTMHNLSSYLFRSRAVDTVCHPSRSEGPRFLPASRCRHVKIQFPPGISFHV